MSIFITILIYIIKILIVIIPILICVAYYTLAERHGLASFQRRSGPNVIGYYGLLQPLNDGFKLFNKETIIPSSSNKKLFITSPMISFIVSMITWIIIPFEEYEVVSSINLGLLFILTISSLGIYGIIMAGWSSNSKYPFLGSLRSTAQMISYEIALGFLMLSVICFAGTTDLKELFLAQEDLWYVYPLCPIFLAFFIAGLAETNRHPFDLPEAEAELVSGYNVEYSSMTFALFSLAEYSQMLSMSVVISFLFLGGDNAIPVNHPIIKALFEIPIIDFFFGLSLEDKMAYFMSYFIWARAGLPRYRYDHLMDIGWKHFLLFALIFLFLIIFISIMLNGLPH